MKLKKAMMSLAAATAAGLCISAYAANPEKGQSGTLNLTDPATNASVTVSGSTVTTNGGSWNSVPAAENGYMVIDCDAATSNEFTVTTATSNPIVQCDFELQVAPVPVSLRPSSAPGAQTAFCVCVDGPDTNFCAYVGGVWTNLTSASYPVPAVDAEYMLRVTFDYKSGKYVKFSVKDANGATWYELSDASSASWFATGSDAIGVSQYCFVGSGNVKSFAMAQSAVEAEVVVDPTTHKEVAIPEAQVAAVEALATEGGQTVAAVLATQATTKFPNLTVGGVTVADAIALGLIAPDNKGEMEVKQTSVKVSGNALAASSDIAINVNVAKPEGSNATIKYTLRGSRDGETFSDVNGYTDMDSVPTIPTSLIGTGDNKYLFFKVKVSVTYPTVNQ